MPSPRSMPRYRKDSLEVERAQSHAGAERQLQTFAFDIVTPETYQQNSTEEEVHQPKSVPKQREESVGSRACGLVPTTSDQFPPSDAFVDTITITVGGSANARTWTLHKDVLAFYSTYFQAALFGWFAEAGKDSISLPDENPETFALFVRWLYTRQIDLSSSSPVLPALTAKQQACQEQQILTVEEQIDLQAKLASSEAGTSTNNPAPCPDSPYRQLIALYLFADRRGIPLLMNDSLDALKSSFLDRWDSLLYDLPYIYANTLPSSGLRRFAFDLVSNTDSRQKCFADCLRQEGFWSEDMLWDVAKLGWSRILPGGRRMLRAEVEKSFALCEAGYHVHEEGVRCKHSRKRHDF